jgi:Replication protein C C-terminal region
MSLRVSRAEGGTKDPSAEIGDEGLPGNRRRCGKRDQQPAGVDGHGISWPFAVGYESALDVFGQKNAAIVIACVLQRAQNINSAGGNLRILTGKARAGEVSFGVDADGCAQGQWRTAAGDGEMTV